MASLGIKSIDIFFAIWQVPGRSSDSSRSSCSSNKSIQKTQKGVDSSGYGLGGRRCQLVASRQ